MDAVQHQQQTGIQRTKASTSGVLASVYCHCSVSFIVVAAPQCSVIRLKNSFCNHWCWELFIKENSAFCSSIQKESHIRPKPSMFKGKCIFNVTINHWLLIGKSFLMWYFWNASSSTENLCFRVLYNTEHKIFPRSDLSSKSTLISSEFNRYVSHWLSPDSPTVSVWFANKARFMQLFFCLHY